jgi:hypothetical protein
MTSLRRVTAEAGFAELSPELNRAITPSKLTNVQNLGAVTLMVGFEVASSKYFGRERVPNLITRNSADWAQQQAVEHCILICIFLRYLTAS